MGVDLSLHPLYLDGHGMTPMPTNVLHLDRERELWAHIRDHLTVKPLDGEYYEYRDEGLRRTTTDPYGTPITWARCDDLSSLLDAWLRRPLQPGEFRSGKWTYAAAGYLERLPIETRVVLWWH